MLPHPKECPWRLSGPALGRCSTWSHTAAAVTPLFTSLCATFFPLTKKTTDVVFISPLCSLCLMVWGFNDSITCTRIITPSFSSWISLLIFCTPCVPLPMCHTCGTVWIFSLSHHSIPSTLITCLWTDLAALILISQNSKEISAVACWCMMAAMVSLAFLFAFMIQTFAEACSSKRGLLTTDLISWSIL